MIIKVKKPEILTLDYLRKYGKQENAENSEVFKSPYHSYEYKIHNSESDVAVPYCGLVYDLVSEGYNNGLKSYKWCDERGVAVIEVSFGSLGGLFSYEEMCYDEFRQSYKTLITFYGEQLRRIFYRSDNETEMNFVFQYNGKINDLETHSDKQRRTDHYWFNVNQNNKLFKHEIKYTEYDNCNTSVSREIGWNCNESLRYDCLKFSDFIEKIGRSVYVFVIDKFKKDYEYIQTVQEISHGKVIKSVYEYKNYPGKVMSTMIYSQTEKKYKGRVFDIDGKVLMDSEFDENRRIRTFTKYDQAGNIKTKMMFEVPDYELPEGYFYTFVVE